MSYLHPTRLHFSGRFQADTSTVNNDVRHFDSAQFNPAWQTPQVGQAANGWWNPEGSGAFRLVDCSITGAVVDGVPIAPGGDPVLGAHVGGSDDRVSGKIVDLDPQQQGASQLWGMEVTLLNKGGGELFGSNFAVAAFIDLWRRQQGDGGGDQTLAACWQSVLTDVVWSSDGTSAALAALQNASSSGMLSIRFNVFGCQLLSSKPDFTLGHITGTIGPAHGGEPHQFTLGRQMIADASPNPTAPSKGVYNFQCVSDPDAGTVIADFGNALPILDGEGTMQPIGDLRLGVLVSGTVDEGDTIGSDRFAEIGALDYLDPGWYQATAGLQGFSFAGNTTIEAHIADRPLVLAKVSGDTFEVLVQESIDGLYVRADNFVYRLNPGDGASVDLYATKYGQPTSGVANLTATPGLMGGGGGAPIASPPIEIPDINTPLGVLDFPATVPIDSSGRGSFVARSSTTGPGNPRVYVDGQMYGIGYQLADQPSTYRSNSWNFLSVLVWTEFPVPTAPNWHEHIEPILTQYGNLYPIMSRHLVDLGSYESVVQHADALLMAFGLSVANPNYMPVTRDMSKAKIQTLLAWLATPGGPPRGPAPPAPAAVAPPPMSPASGVETDQDVEPIGGKTTFINQVLAAGQTEGA